MPSWPTSWSGESIDNSSPRCLPSWEEEEERGQALSRYGMPWVYLWQPWWGLGIRIIGGFVFILFWIFYFLRISNVSNVCTLLPPSFSPSDSSYVLPHPSQIHDLFFNYFYIYSYIFIKMQPSGSIWHCSYVYMFRDYHLWLDKLSGGSSVEKTDSTSLSSH